MKNNTTILLILFLLQFSKISAQDISVGSIANFKFSFNQIRTEYLILNSGDIDRSTKFSRELKINNFNSFGADFRITFNKTYTTGLIVTYGKKIVSKYNDSRRYFNRSLNLLSIEFPVLYNYNINEVLFIEAGLHLGYLKGEYIEEFNIPNPQTSIIEDKKDIYTNSQITFSPVINFVTKFYDHLEVLVVCKYTLNSELIFDELFWSNVESMKYNFNGFNLSLIVNYAF